MTWMVVALAPMHSMSVVMNNNSLFMFYHLLFLCLPFS